MENGTEVPETRGEPADWEALARFLAGESPPEEADAVRAWLAEDPARRERLDALDRSLDRFAWRAPADLDVEGALRRVRARMDEPGARAIPLRRPRERQGRAAGWRPVLRAAAVAALLLIGPYLLWRMVRGERGTSVARTYTTAVGERDSVRLPDGSRVLLGPGSRLTVAAGYGRGSRPVELAGEALFDVPHDASRPFTVRAGAARVRDLGTVFSVHSDPGEQVRVVVTAGSVALQPAASPQGTGVVLRGGDRAVLEPSGRIVPERAAATDDDLAWTRGRLVFRDAPLEQVASDLRRWYGVELRAGDAALAGRRLTASFAGEAPERVLEVVALALGAEVEMRGDTAVLRAR
ncbi:MAG TPA: FecR domain-containing protein [Longimicrobium sp.]|jgi:transmembrane sensor